MKNHAQDKKTVEWRDRMYGRAVKTWLLPATNNDNCVEKIISRIIIFQPIGGRLRTFLYRSLAAPCSQSALKRCLPLTLPRRPTIIRILFVIHRLYTSHHPSVVHESLHNSRPSYLLLSSFRVTFTFTFTFTLRNAVTFIVTNIET